MKDSYPLNIDDLTINSENSVKLFGIEIDNNDNKLSFEQDISIKRLRYLAPEIFKTVNNLNPYYMKEIFSKTKNLTQTPGHKL